MKSCLALLLMLIFIPVIVFATPVGWERQAGDETGHGSGLFRDGNASGFFELFPILPYSFLESVRDGDKDDHNFPYYVSQTESPLGSYILHPSSSGEVIAYDLDFSTMKMQKSLEFADGVDEEMLVYREMPLTVDVVIDILFFLVPILLLNASIFGLISIRKCIVLIFIWLLLWANIRIFMEEIYLLGSDALHSYVGEVKGTIE